ncbi:MAG: hypothetical protein U0350_01480 [Caldilineaceae bacterium]
MQVAKFIKYATGLFYLVGGPLIHAYLIANQRGIYAAVDDQAWPPYQTLWTHLVLPHLVPLVILLVLFEIGAGALMLNRRQVWAERGQWCGLCFNLLLIPFWFAYGIPNLLLVLVHGWLFHQERHARDEQAIAKLIHV